MPNIDDLEFRLEKIIAKIDRIHIVAEDTEQNSTVGKKLNLLKAMTINLDDLFAELDEVCIKLNSLYCKQTPPISTDLTPKYAEVEKKFYNIKAIVMTIISDDAAGIQTSSSAVPRLSLHTPAPGDTYAQVSLPKLQLTKFGGNLLEWPAFYDLFYNSVHTQENISDIHKFMHLKGCLVGEAQSVISSFQISSANYRVAWELLINRYNDPNGECLFGSFI